ncbi:ankyrin repeat domain-containing protein, partial [Vibrio cholerae]|nr:ankyrin repeat domain-containing protein [Vibrio cholerae]
ADVNLQSKSGRTAAYWAASYNQASTLELLHSSGANLDSLDDDGRTPLMVAASKGYIESVIQLVELGVNPELRANDGKTALQLAKANAPAKSVFDGGAMLNTSFKQIVELLARTRQQ